MKQKRKAKKGVTLIETIISVALLAILIVPLSNVVLATFKTNKDGELKQKASFIGQKVLEEMEAYDELKLKNDGSNNFFELLDGDKITEDTSVANSYSGSFNRSNLGNNFRVVLTVVKDNDFSYNSENANNGYDLSYKLSQDIAPGTQKYISQGIETRSFSSDNLVLKIDALNKINISEKNSTSSILLDQSVTPPLKKGISIQLDSTFSTTLNLNVDSAIPGTTEIYIIKDEECTGNVNVTSSSGNIKVNRYVNLADLYNINVTVDKESGTEVLFGGSTKKNIMVK